MKNFVFILFIFFSLQCFAQKLTLQQAIDTALKNSELLKASEYEIEMARTFKKSAFDVNKTNFSYTYGQFNTLYLDNNLTLSQTFAFPTYYTALSRLGTEAISLSELNKKENINALIREIRKTYNQLLYYKSEEYLLEREDSIYSHIVSDVLNKPNNSEARTLELESAQSRLLEIKNQLEENDDNIIEEKYNLQTLLKLNTPVDIADKTLTQLELKIDLNDRNNLLNNNTQLEKLRQDIRLKNSMVKVEKAKLLPDITVAYFSQTIYGPQTIEGQDRFFTHNFRFQGAQVVLGVPIFSRPYMMRIKQARLCTNIAASNLEYAGNHLNGTLLVQLQQLEKYTHSLQYYKQQALPLSEKIITQANKNYDSGSSTYLETVDAFNQAMTIKLNYLHKLKNYNDTVIELEYLSGVNK